MDGKFDIYTEWLEIPAGPRPPDYYTLLGLFVGENDVVAIEHAAFERMKLVRPRCLKFPAEGAQLLNEISAARVCLGDPVRREQYRHELARASLPEKLQQKIKDQNDEYALKKTDELEEAPTFFIAENSPVGSISLAPQLDLTDPSGPIHGTRDFPKRGKPAGRGAANLRGKKSKIVSALTIFSGIGFLAMCVGAFFIFSARTNVARQTVSPSNQQLRTTLDSDRIARSRAAPGISSPGTTKNDTASRGLNPAVNAGRQIPLPETSQTDADFIAAMKDADKALGAFGTPVSELKALRIRLTAHQARYSNHVEIRNRLEGIELLIEVKTIPNRDVQSFNFDLYYQRIKAAENQRLLPDGVYRELNDFFLKHWYQHLLADLQQRVEEQTRNKLFKSAHDILEIETLPAGLSIRYHQEYQDWKRKLRNANISEFEDYVSASFKQINALIQKLEYIQAYAQLQQHESVAIAILASPKARNLIEAMIQAWRDSAVKNWDRIDSSQQRELMKRDTLFRGLAIKVANSPSQKDKAAMKSTGLGGPASPNTKNTPIDLESPENKKRYQKISSEIKRFHKKEDGYFVVLLGGEWSMHAGLDATIRAVIQYEQQGNDKIGEKNVNIKDSMINRYEKEKDAKEFLKKRKKRMAPNPQRKNR